MTFGHGLDELFKEYKVLVFRTERIYIESLTNRNFDLENTTPYSLLIDNYFEARDRAWTKIIVKALQYLQLNYPRPLEELYSFHTEWSNARVFGPEKFIQNCEFVSDNLFVSVNFTSRHALWFIQDILKLYNIDLSSCYILIHRSPSSEPKPVREYIERVVKAAFRNFLINEKKKSEMSADNIIKSLETMNKVLAKMSPGYNNLFLFDTALVLSNYKSKLLHEHSKYCVWSDKQITIVKKCLDFYTEFFSKVTKYLDSFEHKQINSIID